MQVCSQQHSILDNINPTDRGCRVAIKAGTIFYDDPNVLIPLIAGYQACGITARCRRLCDGTEQSVSTQNLVSETVAVCLI
jgi:hypothetical protein